jgi:twitching motility protein PilJ
MALDLRESVAGFKLPEEDMSEGRASAARKAMATTPAMDFDSNSEVIDLDDELLPDDDIFATSKA